MKTAVADPITTEVIRNFVISCAEDMNAALWRSAFSAIIYEGRDSAVALLDESGNMLGQSTGVPLFVGAIDACVKLVLERYGDDMAPGDIFILNDSYLQGTHLHDITAVGPLFHRGELAGFGAARAHWQDIGAIDPGSTMGSTSIFHEGLRLGPTRIVHRFKPIPEWYDLLVRNTRLKTMTIGDLNAQISAIRTGEKRLSRLLERVGLDVYRAACANIFEQARILDRMAIGALKDGAYRREGFLDNDGVSDEPVKIALTLTIEGERMVIDLEGSSGPVTGSINCGAVQTVSLLRLAYKTMINPERAITGGSFSTMEVRIPENCLFNAKEPAACEWYFTGLGLLGDLMISCLSEAMPERATAAHYGDSMVAAFFNMDKKDDSWISVEATAGGWGGTVGADGESALINLVNGGFRNLPAEVYETKFPVRVEEFSLRRDSGGAGRWRGGCGVVRTYLLLDDCYCALWFDRAKTPAWGLADGGDGLGPKNEIIHPDGRVEHPLKMRARSFKKGTRIVTRTGGGGGYGDPLARSLNEVLEDVRSGLVSRDKACELYGVRIDARMVAVEAESRGIAFAPGRAAKEAPADSQFVLHKG
jgi:N-methylhydantoinase B